MLLGLSAGEYISNGWTVTGTEAALEENAYPNDQLGMIFGIFSLLFSACASTDVKNIASGTIDQSKVLYFHIALLMKLNLEKPTLDVDSRLDRACLLIGFILVPLAVLILILVSNIIADLLCLIYLFFCKINQNEKPVIVSIASLVSQQLNTILQYPMLRGPGDRPSKHDYLPINMALRQPSVAIQPMISLDDDYRQVSTTNLRNRNINMSAGRNLVSHKFDGGIAETDNCRDMMKDLPYGTVPTTDKLSTTSSGYITATSPKISSCSLENNDHKVSKYGVSYLDEGELKSKVKSGVSGYGRSEYPVLIGNTVVVCDTKAFASLPQHSKYMVKIKVKDASGIYKVKMALKSTNDNVNERKHELNTLDRQYNGGDDDVETDGAIVEKAYFRKNCKSTGYVIFSCDKLFRGDIRYPLPSMKAASSGIGKGGNGFVFIMYHGKKQYAVKKTIYRQNEINVQSSLQHVNILPLLAVLMGEKHEHHSGRFYCFHFMPKMDYDLRQILSIKQVGCLKYLYINCSKSLTKFKTAFHNVKYIFKETLKALAYIHSNGYVHRDVKASNIMIKVSCKCNPLYCDCSVKFKVKLGDFDSAGAIPGLGITEPTDQMIKFASILPLGTPGYRAPEVSMHITLSGPYETLYTTAVDMWSFGCLCLNVCIGKTAAVKQREEASLLLSKTHQCSKELWQKTTKFTELEKTKPFCDDKDLLTLIHQCLQVDSKLRPSALQAQQYLSIP